MLRSDRNILPTKSHSGRWLVVGLFAMGLIVLGGLFAGRAYFRQFRIEPPTTAPAR